MVGRTAGREGGAEDKEDIFTRLQGKCSFISDDVLKGIPRGGEQPV